MSYLFYIEKINNIIEDRLLGIASPRLLTLQLHKTGILIENPFLKIEGSCVWAD